jgi:K+-transporting ATPase KdpF subunit
VGPHSPRRYCSNPNGGGVAEIVQMSRKLSRFGLTPREHRISALPSTIGGIVVLAITTFNGSVLWPQSADKTALLLVFGLLGILYMAVLDLVIIPSPNFRPYHGWINSILVSLGLLVYLFFALLKPESLQ